MLVGVVATMVENVQAPPVTGLEFIHSAVADAKCPGATFTVDTEEAPSDTAR